MEIPGSKAERLLEAEDEVEKITKLYRKGLITDEERYRKTIETWQGANDRITKALMDNLDKYNPIYMMPTKKYEKETGRRAIIGAMATESRLLVHQLV